jgi:hypothetical protein
MGPIFPCCREKSLQVETLDEISKILGDLSHARNDNVMLLTTISAGAYDFLA